ncbi:hypothetical protein M707_06195 [Arthrobacter sp. AK-YN10]|jgi:hypothetical protein|nr:hypothetical protein M707_06195 [Arthrobacter sp. AK-YN10]GLU58959.1 hypothetical protein Pure01_14720 [Paenarthrobacter ureafaciens]GLU63226.1 hypothetical protein Pure02_14760 [Paenarthrobacter ureafaciens]GLU67501.1 hypothetical protein Pure03_14770 [Paenarthrobacter ureafaciens]GLU71839.1 hypothetical protein Pure04_15540 [Paenarthrobacter ureafaciens]
MCGGRTLIGMGMEGVISAVVSLGLVLTSIWAGVRLVGRGVPAKGATGTLGSVLSMIEPATGAPTRWESAAAVEEMRQRRHEHLTAGPRVPGGDPYDGRIVLGRGPTRKDGGRFTETNI